MKVTDLTLTLFKWDIPMCFILFHLDPIACLGSG